MTDQAAPRTFAEDPYRSHRSDGHALLDFGLGPFPLIVGYDDVRAAARDWRTFTSDTPFEVPIPPEHDVRSVRQLPIEVDPPLHGELRAVVAEPFTRGAVERHRPVVEHVVASTLEGLGDDPTIEVVEDLALPVVNHALAAALGRPPADADAWCRWGTHVFDDDSGARRPNAELDAYLAEVIEGAVAEPDDSFFGRLAAARIDGRPLDRDEMMGFANLVFAGGRDTVVTAIVASLWYFATHPDDWQRLVEDPELVATAVEELLRISSPLPFIGRHSTRSCSHAGATLEAGELLALGFAAANRDPAAFDRPDSCVIDRRPNRHIAFGHGPHTCLGAHLARMEIGTTLATLLRSGRTPEAIEPPRAKEFPIGDQLVGYAYDALVVRLC